MKSDEIIQELATAAAIRTSGSALKIIGRVLELQHAIQIQSVIDQRDDPHELNNAVRSLLDQYWKVV